MDYVRHVLAALASAFLIACGGGDGAADLDPAPPTSIAAAPADVQVEGCVIDDAGEAAAIPVHARGEDGRLVASTVSDERGLYRLRLHAQHSVGLSTEPAGNTALVLLTGRSNLSIGACLRRASA